MLIFLNKTTKNNLIIRDNFVFKKKTLIFGVFTFPYTLYHR